MEGAILLLSSLLSILLLTEASEMPFQERMLLKALGLSRRPKPVNPPPVPKSLLDIFEKGVKEDNPCWMDGFNVPGNIVRSYRNQGPSSQSEKPQGSLCVKKHLFFDVTAVEKTEQITLGQLEIQFGHKVSHGQEFHLRLYQNLHISLNGMRENPTNRKLLVNQSFRLLNKSLYFNLTKVIEDWTNPEKNMGLILEISTDVTANGSSAQCEQIHPFIHTSLLTVSLDPSSCKTTRPKRSIPPSLPTPNNLCQKRRLYISFKDVGWHNWIIAPKGYMANYCHGECPYPLTEVLKGTNHAVIQSLVHGLDPELTPLPCCGPTKLSPISMLYYDNNDNVVLRHYKDMVVDDCGCK
ncbi:growth/differentiation factor 3-like [Spea bombifrons]|uniref:growth/differentiation factor 3-like n=1 Tax=Spea bombifrons TaxID=233779 RepID=UPI002349A2A2|nr:growth/differentiation factor 3-like [Spea bombifrons]